MINPLSKRLLIFSSTCVPGVSGLRTTDVSADVAGGLMVEAHWQLGEQESELTAELDIARGV